MGGPAVKSATSSAAAITTYAGTPAVFQFTAADYGITGRTTKLRMRATLLNNQSATAGQTLTVGLYPVTAVGGANDAVSVTLGTPVSGSTLAFSSIAANSSQQKVTTDFDVPSDGLYVLGFNITTTLGGSTLTNVLADLQVRNQ